MKVPLHSCIAKVVIVEDDPLRVGPQWITARRGTLYLFEDHLKMWEVVNRASRDTRSYSFIFQLADTEDRELCSSGSDEFEDVSLRVESGAILAG